MGLNDFEVFNEYAYSAMTEVLQQQIELFNAATRGALVLRSGAHQGDFSDRVHYAKINGLVRRRNVYGAGTVAEVELQHLLDTAVKVAAGTPPVRMDPAWWEWMALNQEEAGAVFGQQLATDTLADYLNTAITAVVAALSAEAGVQHTSAATATYNDLLAGTEKFGDRSERIQVWVAHSHTMFDIWGTNLANAERLFTFGTVNVVTDPFGRPIIVTDSPSLVSGTDYRTLGLVPGAAIVDENPDFLMNTETKNGNENIQRTVQAEWSFNLGVKGFAWDKASGGKSPSDMAIGSSASWDRYTSDIKDLAGVLVTTK